MIKITNINIACTHNELKINIDLGPRVQNIVATILITFVAYILDIYPKLVNSIIWSPCTASLLIVITKNVEITNTEVYSL